METCNITDSHNSDDQLNTVRYYGSLCPRYTSKASVIMTPEKKSYFLRLIDSERTRALLEYQMFSMARD